MSGNGRKSPGKPARLGALVGEVLSRNGLTRRLDLSSAVERWAKVVGPRVAANAWAESVSADGVLWVRVRSSPWATELALMTPKILAHLNAGRQGKIQGIRWLVGVPPRDVRPRPAEVRTLNSIGE